MKLTKDHPQVVALMDDFKKAYKVATDLMAKATTETRSLTAEETATCSAAIAEAKRHKGLADELVGMSILDAATGGGAANPRRPAGDGDAAGGTTGAGDEGVVLTKADRRQILSGYLCSQSGAGAMAHIRKHVPDFEAKANSISSLFDPEAGYLVQNEERATEFIQRIRDETEIIKMAREIRIGGRSITFPNLDFSGAPQPVEEDGTTTERNWGDFLGKTQFVPQRFSDVFFFPRDWAEDGIMDVEALLIDLTIQLHVEEMENQVVNGIGANGPVGLFVAPFNTSDTDNASLVLTPEDFRRLPYKIKKQYRRGSGYIMTRAVVEQVALMRSDSGAGAGTGDFLWRMGMEAGQPDRLNGYPILESEFAPAYTNVAASIACVFGDLRWYWVVTRRDVRFQRLVELRAVDGQIGLLSDFRFDGAPVLKEPFVNLIRKA